MTTATQIVKERPIPFSSEMVRAILRGRKTMTRRIVKPEPVYVPEDCWSFYGKGSKVNYTPTVPEYAEGQMQEILSYCPYGVPGNRLYVKETYLNHALPGYTPVYFYRADGDEKPHDRTWKSGRFMPKNAARIHLEIMSVRVERLKDITAEDIVAEGVNLHPDNVTRDLQDYFPPPTEDSIDDAWTAYYRAGFAELWDRINGKKHPWSSNPWVWVIKFRKV